MRDCLNDHGEERWRETLDFDSSLHLLFKIRFIFKLWCVCVNEMTVEARRGHLYLMKLELQAAMTLLPNMDVGN